MFTIFCHLKSPNEAYAFLEEHNADLEGDGDKWQARFYFGGGLLKKKQTITINYDREWCSPPNWPQQISGMRNFLSNWPMDDEQGDKVMALVSNFAFCLGIENKPDIADADDTRLEIIHALADHMDGVIFTPSALLDSQFRPIVSADGENDPEAELPDVPELKVEIPEHLQDDLEQYLDDLDDEMDEDVEVEPPSPERVAKRLFVMMAIAARGLLDMNLGMGNKPAYSQEKLRSWLGELDVHDEIEPLENLILDAPEGELDQQDTLNSVWTLEGLVVLAWALNLAKLPRYDELVSTDELMKALGFLDVDASRAILADPKLRSEEMLLTYNNQIFALNWRMVDFRVRPEACDFANVVIAGSLFDLSWAGLKDGDLALRGTAITKADPELVSTVSSLAVERHKASNWLVGYAHLYSRVSTDT